MNKYFYKVLRPCEFTYLSTYGIYYGNKIDRKFGYIYLCKNKKLVSENIDNFYANQNIVILKINKNNINYIETDNKIMMLNPLTNNVISKVLMINLNYSYNFFDE